MSTLMVRSLGSGRTHLANQEGLCPQPVTIFGSSGEVVTGPVATLCRAVLTREPIVVMTDPGDGLCRTCEALGEEG